MVDLVTATAAVTGIGGVLLGAGALWNQRRQTQIMAASLAKDLEAPDSEIGTGIESKLRSVINRRLSENRSKMRQEFAPRLAEIEQLLQEKHLADVEVRISNLIRLLGDNQDIKDMVAECRNIRDNLEAIQQRVLAEVDRYRDDVATHSRDIDTLRRQFEDLQSNIAYLDTVRSHARVIAQQLLQLSNPGQ